MTPAKLNTLSSRPYWRCYYANTDAIIYVVDSVDRERLSISKSELISMLEVSVSFVSGDHMRHHVTLTGGGAQDSIANGLCQQAGTISSTSHRALVCK